MKAIKKLIKEERATRRPYQGRKASDQIDREERNTKAFNSNFKPRNTKKLISKLYKMTGTVPSPPDETTGVSETADDAVGMSEVAANYYKSLMSEKTTVNTARDTLTSKLAERPFSKSASDRMEGAITEQEVRRQIRKMARRKACGPDGLAA